MKQLILMTLLSAGAVTSQAQITELNINRNTECDVWIEFLGSDGTCSVTNTTGPILYSGMPTGTITGLNPTSFTWIGTPPDPTHLIAAIIYSGNPSSDCGSNSVTIGVSSCSYPQFDNLPFYDDECHICGSEQHHVEWNGTIDATIEIQ